MAAGGRPRGSGGAEACPADDVGTRSYRRHWRRRRARRGVVRKAPDDWAPYRYGHWRWAAPRAGTGSTTRRGALRRRMGRTRIARWRGRAYRSRRRDAHPIYMPATVNFIGSAGVGLSAPTDRLGRRVVSARAGRGLLAAIRAILIRRINAGVVRMSRRSARGRQRAARGVITAHYQNWRFATVVPQAVFAGGRRRPAQIPAAGALGNAPLLLGSPQPAAGLKAGRYRDGKCGAYAVAHPDPAALAGNGASEGTRYSGSTSAHAQTGPPLTPASHERQPAPTPSRPMREAPGGGRMSPPPPAGRASTTESPAPRPRQSGGPNGVTDAIAFRC
jgi:hypothetical protein